MHNMPVQQFLDELASAAPTPGGGGAAAIMGAMGAALISMVANLTIGKKGYEAVEGEMKSQLAAAEALRARLTDMVADDVNAFNQLMAAYKLPKDTEEDKSARSEAIQESLKQATRVPLACAHACAEVIRVAQRSAEHGNRSVISDTGAGVLAVQAALRTASLNVGINVPSIKDATFAAVAQQEIDTLLNECLPLTEAVLARVQARMVA
ncbi:MAG: cyclodeaminase/cyclohydrolase family protein [Betaproteobacteria bacterium]|nr:cyclodeaminase/cyclohydrolase family protein [Betaproteobacteria bacterium]